MRVTSSFAGRRRTKVRSEQQMLLPPSAPGDGPLSGEGTLGGTAAMLLGNLRGSKSVIRDLIYEMSTILLTMTHDLLHQMK